MELDKIRRLKEQVGHMEDTPTNLSEATGALCSFFEELIMAVNNAQRELDDLANYRMEQNERNA